MNKVIHRKANRRDELEFMPAALEILATPPSPFGRIIAVVIGAFFAAAIIWASIGTVNVVAVMPGIIVPNGYIKVIQPLETGVVRAIHVVEGQHITQNDLLIELDLTEVTANVDSLRNDYLLNRAEVAINEALLTSEPLANIQFSTDIPNVIINNSIILLTDTWQSHIASQQAISAEINLTNAEIASLHIEKEKIHNILPLIEERLDATEVMWEKRATEKSTLVNLQQQVIEYRASLEAIEEKNKQLIAKIHTLEARKIQSTADFRRAAIEKKRDAMRQVAALEQAIKKEEQRQYYRQLRAPVSGIIHQMQIHTIGAVVNTADQLMAIVPDNTTLEVEASALNKDIGFVHEGQPVEVKLEAFPFTRYGILHGKLTALSKDAVLDQELGPVYKATITLDTQYLEIGNKKMPLTPGMNATVEVQTDKRSIISFFLSPLMRYKDEAIRER